MPESEAAAVLFTVPVRAVDRGTRAGGCGRRPPAPGVTLLALHSPPENRLTSAVCAALLEALDRVEFGGARPPGVVLTTSALPKFYSNGLDLDEVQALAAAEPSTDFFAAWLYPLFRRLLAFPCPTVAVVNGHAFAAGLMLAMHHDYRVMNPERGFACLNELDFGAPLRPPMSAIFRQKTADPAVYRRLVLEAARLTGPDALQAGLVDAVGGLDRALSLVRERRLVGRADSGIYAVMRMEMYRETLALLDDHPAQEARDRRIRAAEDARKDAGRKRVAALVEADKAKL